MCVISILRVPKRLSSAGTRLTYDLLFPDTEPLWLCAQLLKNLGDTRCGTTVPTGNMANYKWQGPNPAIDWCRTIGLPLSRWPRKGTERKCTPV